MKTIEYCLPAVNLSAHQWDKIMSKVLSAALPKCCYSKSLPLAVRFGPVQHGGIGIQHPFYTGGVAKLTSLIQESACDSQTGALMNTSIEDFRLEVGT